MDVWKGDRCVRCTNFYPEYTADNIEKFRRLLPPRRHMNQPLMYLEMWYKGDSFVSELRLDFLNERKDIYPHAYRTQKAVELNSNGLHSHDYYELCVVSDGSVPMRIGGTIQHFQAGEALILNKNIAHVELFDRPAKILYLAMTDSYLNTMLNTMRQEQFVSNGVLESFLTRNLNNLSMNRSEYLHFKPLTPLSIAPTVSDISRRFRSKHVVSANSHITADILDVMETLCDAHLYSVEYCDMGLSTETSLSEIIKRIIDESGGAITRGELSKKLNYNPTYISRMLKKYTGHSIKEYCQFCRMEALRVKLITSNESISAIIKQLGFENKTQVYRVFKRIYGCTPKAYRSGVSEKEATEF